MSDVTTQIALNVCELRRSRKLTLQQVADRSGLAKSYVWEIENGDNTNPSIVSLSKLCVGLGCSLGDLVGKGVYTHQLLRPEAMRIAVQVDAIIREKEASKEPCGECHLQPGETCDICNARWRL